MIYDVWLCDVHDCGEGKPPDQDYVSPESFDTQQQCLAYIRRLIKILNHTPSAAEMEREGSIPHVVLTFDNVWSQAEADSGTVVDRIGLHCEGHGLISGVLSSEHVVRHPPISR